MTDQWWSWVIFAVGLAGFFLAGKKIWWAWYVNIANQVLWTAYAIVTQQWGFLVATGFYFFVFSRNAYLWTKEHREKSMVPQGTSRLDSARKGTVRKDAAQATDETTKEEEVTRHNVNTVHVVGVDEIAVDLWYPRREERYKSIRISLMDVRAANDILISYDFDRDGWVITSDLTDPRSVDEYTKEEWDALPEVEGEPGVKDRVSKLRQEVAFIPAWPQRKDYPDAVNTEADQQSAGKDVGEGDDPWPA